MKRLLVTLFSLSALVCFGATNVATIALPQQTSISSNDDLLINAGGTVTKRITADKLAHSILFDSVTLPQVSQALRSGIVTPKPLAGYTLTVFGDSIAWGKWASWPDTTNTSNGYARQAADALGATLVNYSYPGFCLVDQQSNIFSSVITSGSISVLALGANDNRNRATNTAYFQPMQLGQMLWLSIPQAAKLNGRQALTNSSCSTFNMAGDALAYMPGCYSFNPSSVTVSNLNGTNIAFGLLIGTNDVFATNISVYVDGSLNTNVTVQVPTFPSQNGYDRIYAEAGFLITNLSAGNHTLLVSNGPGALWGCEWVSASGSWTNLQPVFAVETTYQSTGYIWGGSAAGVDLLNSMTVSNVIRCQAAGLPVYHVTVNGLVNPATLTDGIHQNPWQHTAMGAALARQIYETQKAVKVTALDSDLNALGHSIINAGTISAWCVTASNLVSVGSFAPASGTNIPGITSGSNTVAIPLSTILQAVATSNSASVTFSGDGTSGSPLTATASGGSGVGSNIFTIAGSTGTGNPTPGTVIKYTLTGTQISGIGHPIPQGVSMTFDSLYLNINATSPMTNTVTVAFYTNTVIAASNVFNVTQASGATSFTTNISFGYTPNTNVNQIMQIGFTYASNAPNSSPTWLLRGHYN